MFGNLVLFSFLGDWYGSIWSESLHSSHHRDPIRPKGDNPEPMNVWRSTGTHTSDEWDGAEQKNHNKIHRIRWRGKAKSHTHTHTELEKKNPPKDKTQEIKWDARDSTEIIAEETEEKKEETSQ